LHDLEIICVIIIPLNDLAFSVHQLLLCKIWTKALNWLYAQLHYFLNCSQLLVSCLPLLDKLD